MAHQSNVSQDFDPKKFFTKARKIYIEDPLKALGFKRYKSSVVARVTKGNILQFLAFQKAAYGGQSFTVNVAIRPLFSRNNEYLTLMPGNRLGLMSTEIKNDIWWTYATERETKQSFEDIFTRLENYALPFFNNTTTSNDIIGFYEKDVLGKNRCDSKIDWGTSGWKDFDLGHIYLHSGEIKKASMHFNDCFSEFSKDNREWAQTASKKCLEIKEIIKLGQSEIDKYLFDTINDSKLKLKLTGW